MNNQSWQMLPRFGLPEEEVYALPGIIRRIDDLGRVVIPKIVREELNLEEGTPMKIYIDKEERKVIFVP